MTPEQRQKVDAALYTRETMTSRLGAARPSEEIVPLQRLDMPAARWEENARALLKMALELAYECRMWCYDHATHDEQIKHLRALEAEWAGSGISMELTDRAQEAARSDE